MSLFNSFDNLLDAIESGRAFRSGTVGVFYLTSLVHVAIPLMFVALVGWAIIQQLELPFIAWIGMLSIGAIGVIMVVLQAKLVSRRISSVRGTPDGQYAILPLTAKFIRYQSEAMTLTWFAYNTVALLLILFIQAASYRFGGAFHSAAALVYMPFGGIFGQLFAFVIGLIATAIGCTLILVVGYALSAIIEGYADLIESNRSIKESCQLALQDLTP